MDRNPELPFVIEIVAGDTPVITGLEIWVAVVVKDSSGNKLISDNLNVVSAQSKNDGFDDSGNYIKDVDELEAKWFEETDIIVTWSHENSGNIMGYKVFISDSPFDNINQATEIGDTSASLSFLITNDNFDSLDNQTTWYIAVSPYDDFTNKVNVNYTELAPVGATAGNTG